MVTVARKFTRYRDDADNDYVDNVGDGYHDDYAENNGKDVCCEWKPLFCFCSLSPLPPFTPTLAICQESFQSWTQKIFHLILNLIFIFL